MNGLIKLTPFDLFLATSLILVAAIISILLRIGLERRLLLAALRATVQLGLVGLILEKVFAIRHPLPVIALLLVMVFFAGREAVARSAWKYKGIRWDTWLTMLFSSFFVGGLITQVVVGVKPWYHPQYIIPILGMILGNSLNGIALGLDRFLDYFVSRRAEIELYLAFGASRSETLNEPLRTSVYTGMIPVINCMSVVGIVSLPGMMTGQILAGSPPLQAVAYQLLIMFTLAGANAFGAMLIAVMAARRLVSQEGWLNLEELEANSKRKQKQKCKRFKGKNRVKD
ncbi:iron export ABC transporter permease subunit FetB [Desulfohalobiaceae bacterium Ax17]|jgi:putative ABC transport system permease protein|uniref:ABC transporter permease n=1 Tax=Desulfovulcanus ferrireducens TaxID=2831190 RepID=UPI00207BB2B9|nr:iron export ABC transporter permease subunit FetB [Desulfovulcanus ferrireducens]MBT8764528.1 iron export ABC transporter permease subunit FetB [Desulfovulcanus ferrireducens]